MSRSRSLTDASRVDELLARLQRKRIETRSQTPADSERSVARKPESDDEAAFTDLPGPSSAEGPSTRREAPTNPAAAIPIPEASLRQRAPSLPTRAVPPPQSFAVPPQTAAQVPAQTAAQAESDDGRVSERFASSDVIEAAKMRALERARRIAAATGDGPGERVTDNVQSPEAQAPYPGAVNAEETDAAVGAPEAEPAEESAQSARSETGAQPVAKPDPGTTAAPADAEVSAAAETSAQPQQTTPAPAPRESVSTLTLPRVNANGDLQRQFDKLLSTLMGAFEASGAFIADRSGLPLSLREVSDEVVARSSLAWHLFEEAGTGKSADLVMVRRDGEHHTYIYMVTSTLGPIAVALRCAKPVAPQLAELARTALTQALNVD